MLFRFVSDVPYATCNALMEIAKELATREQCRATACFLETEFGKLSKEINQERKKMRQQKMKHTPNAQDTQDAYDDWQLTVGVSIRPWNPTEEREADLGEM